MHFSSCFLILSLADNLEVFLLEDRAVFGSSSSDSELEFAAVDDWDEDCEDAVAVIFLN